MMASETPFGQYDRDQVLARSTVWLQAKIVAWLGKNVSEIVSLLGTKPLDLICDEPLPAKLRIYCYYATNPPGERSVGDYKIQLVVPGQGRGNEGFFDFEAGWRVILVGYVADFDVMVFWDPTLHDGFPYSKNLQVHPQTIYTAAVHGFASQKRAIRRSRAKETVMAFRASELSDAVPRWLQLRASSIGEV